MPGATADVGVDWTPSLRGVGRHWLYAAPCGGWVGVSSRVDSAGGRVRLVGVKSLRLRRRFRYLTATAVAGLNLSLQLTSCYWVRHQSY